MGVKKLIKLPTYHDLQSRLVEAIDIAIQYGGADGAHHKAWVIDQMVRALAGPDYEGVVEFAKAGEDGSETYEWEVGIAP